MATGGALKVAPILIKMVVSVSKVMDLWITGIFCSREFFHLLIINSFSDKPIYAEKKKKKKKKSPGKKKKFRGEIKKKKKKKNRRKKKNSMNCYSEESFFYTKEISLETFFLAK